MRRYEVKLTLFLDENDLAKIAASGELYISLWDQGETEVGDLLIKESDDERRDGS